MKLGKRLNKLLKAQRQMQGSNGSVPVDESGKVRRGPGCDVCAVN